MKAHDMNTESATNDLTQLSSREQLSALMDGALPPDQTRFLLRRLQHDAPLAESWERWRLAGETMRGLAPAQRLPADFALRVGAALRGEDAPAMRSGGKRMPTWLRWGGGAAMAASLAVVALIARQPDIEAPSASTPVQLAASPVPAVEAPVVPAPATQAPQGAGDAVQPLIAASAVVASVRPQRDRAAGQSREAERLQAAVVRNDRAQLQAAVASNDLPIPQPDIVTRPWPRSVLPQYASGGLAVGFGEHARGATAYNPFQSQADIGNLPPLANVEAPQGTQATGADADPQREPQP